MNKDFFSENVKSTIKSAIEEASGNEVFFVGSFSRDQVIEDVKVVARGNDYSVPAVIESASPGEVVIHNHPSGNLTPSNQDIQIASVFGNHGVGFLIVDNTASQVYVVVEPFFEKEIELLDVEETKKALLPEGAVADIMGDKYEVRDEQLLMLESVTSSFNQNLVSLVEAGTGTGKTLSYLVPAINWALKNEERVVISTNTINLQEQLIDKDIPLLYDAFDDDFKYSLVKGMRNYLCLLRTETIQEGLLRWQMMMRLDQLMTSWSGLKLQRMDRCLTSALHPLIVCGRKSPPKAIVVSEQGVLIIQGVSSINPEEK